MLGKWFAVFADHLPFLWNIVDIKEVMGMASSHTPGYNFIPIDTI